VNADEAMAFLAESHESYQRSKADARPLRFLACFMLLVAVFNFVLAFTVATLFSLIPAFICLGTSIFGFYTLRTNKRSNGENI
jgi:hypothetical protein